MAKEIQIRQSKSAADVRAGAVAWAKAIAADNSFHYGGNPPACYSRGCYFCGTNKHKKGKMQGYDKTYCCNTFVFSAYAHGGGEPDMLAMCKKGGNARTDLFSGRGQSKAAKHWENKGRLSSKNLKLGDVVVYSKHWALYIGDGKIAEAQHHDNNKPGSGNWNSSIKISNLNTRYEKICRYVGKGGGWMCLPSGSDDTSIDVDDTDSSEEYENAIVVDDGRAIVLKDEISKLYSSANYEYLDTEEEENEVTQRFTKDLFISLSNSLAKADANLTTAAIKEVVLPDPSGLPLDKVKFQHNKPEIIRASAKSSLLSFPTYVEAPTILLDFNGIKIGGYGNKGDIYPNYISGMTVEKVNGKINNYTINLTYQIRPGEDPNFIDKLISRTGYRNPLKIIYGDSMYEGGYFKDEELVITNVTHNEDISSYKINYIITAISSIGISKTAFKNFTSTSSKPSTEIYNLLYTSGEASNTLLSMFPGMQNRTLVSSYNLIPTTDSVINISSMTNVSPISRLSYLTAAMTSESGSKSSYFLTYNDTKNNPLGGAYFKITEVTKTDLNSVNSAVYTLDVGYPSDNNITNFSINTQDYWSLVYQNTGQLKTWEYGIDDDGKITAEEVNLLNKGAYGKNDLLSTKWWEEVTEYPISARVVIKGLLAPAMLMSYIYINTYFYGIKDMASGLYVVTAQKDSIQGSGYTTELTLLRVSY